MLNYVQNCCMQTMLYKKIMDLSVLSPNQQIYCLQPVSNHIILTHLRERLNLVELGSQELELPI